MRRHRQYTYRLTTRGIDYVKNICVKNICTQTIVDAATFADDWSIRRRHDTRHKPFNFELWINDTTLVDRWTAEAMRRWRQTGYIVPHADTFLAKQRRVEKLLSKVSIEEDQ